MSVIIVVGWVLVALAVIALVSRIGPVAQMTVAAVLHDASPLVLAGTWVALALGVVARNVPLIVASTPFVALHGYLLVRMRSARRAPAWTRGAPTVRIGVSNVFVDNDTPDAMARTLIDADVDVLVVLERNPAFVAALRAAGGDTVYPHRLDDPDDDSDYAAMILAREPFVDTTVERFGDFRILRAEIDVAGRTVTLLGANPWAAVDPGGAQRWAEQIGELTDYVHACAPPTIVAGDLNSTQFRPDFERLLEAGLADAHDLRGQGLAPSFKLGAGGVLGAIGPVARLDHLLVSEGTFPLALHDLDASGSDHVPFVATVAVRPDAAR